MFPSGRAFSPADHETVLATMGEMELVLAPERSPLIAYLFSYRATREEIRRQVAAQVDRLGDDDIARRAEASACLMELGYPAFMILSQTREVDPEARGRIQDILHQLRPIHEMVERRGLDHDVEFLDRLATCGSEGLRRRARDRLVSILPEEARQSPDWWRENRRRFSWDAAAQKFVPVPGGR